jgi:CheY-like chemotaxis protein
VLVVEDDDDAADLAAYALGRASTRHEAVRVRDGAEALAFLRARRSRSERPAVVLLDLQLPRVVGLDVLESARRDPETRHLPIVILSASADPEGIAECYLRGANSYLQKPIALDAFREHLALALFYWCELNIPPGGEEATRLARRHASEGVRAAAEVAQPCSLPIVLGSAEAHAHAVAKGLEPPLLVLDADEQTRAQSIAGLADVAGKTPILGVGSTEEAAAAMAASVQCGGRSPWTCPRLIVVDIDKRTEEGVEMIRQVRSLVDHRLPVVFFTRRDDPDFIERCYQHAPSSVVRKPGGAEDYRDTARLIGHYWLRLNRTVAYGVVPMPAVSEPVGA